MAKIYKKITSPEQLRGLIEHGHNEYAILLGGGVMRSSKHISLNSNGTLSVYNEIDGTRQSLTDSALFTRSNIGEAMQKGAFIRVN